MSEQHKPEDFNDLVQAATRSVHQQQDRAAALTATPASRPRTQQILALLLLVVMVGVFAYQYPRIDQPYALPDPETDSRVVAAELELMGELIESYRLSQGAYPDSLDKVRMPAGLAEVVAESKLEYQLKGEAYVLDWRLVHWRAVLDGGTGKLQVTAASAAP